MSLKLKNFLGYLLCVGLGMILVLPGWVAKQFGNTPFDQVIYLWLSDGQGGVTDFSTLFSFFVFMAPPVIIMSFVYWWYQKRLKTNPTYVTKFYKKGTKISLVLKFSLKRILIFVLVIGIYVFVAYDRHLNIIGFFVDNVKTTDIYETHYVDPKDVTITFPKKKRNLIYIVLESMETNFSNMNIEDKDVSLIPDLQKLSEDNISFSNTKGFGGAKQVRGTTWTAGSLVGQTSGIPIQISKPNTSFGEEGGFLDGLTTIGEVLEDQGYHNYFLIGSDARFGGRETYFKTHGNYKIMDIKYYKEIGKIDEDYNVFWGYEDKKLFEHAKEELLEISKESQPFNLTMLTVDSHFTEGYVDESCDLIYEENYPNAILCSNNKIIEFVNWIKAQDFYENTTVILSGDHYTMNNVFAQDMNNEERSIFNTFINVDVDTLDTANFMKRDFSVLDMFPTTLSAIGAKIEGDRLGLGVNLFSQEKTIIEEMGFDELDIELGKRSDFYNNTFFEPKK